MGECVLIVENSNGSCAPGGFVHCPPMTAPTFVADHPGPCVISATGDGVTISKRVSLRSELALRYEASSAVDTENPERRGTWEVRRPARWDEVPWAERP
jgi:hypothetical protein